MTTQAAKAEAFSALHEGEPFVIPNPWDAGSAKLLEALGFVALATTSGGFALTLGRNDGKVSPDELAEHVRALAEATELPVSVDLENGGAGSDDVAAAITRVAEAGAVGGSIEDWDPAPERLYEQAEAVERLAAAREAADRLDFPFTLTGRAENHFRGNPDLDDTIARLRAYGQAGADVLYAPGLRTTEEIDAVCDAVSKPVNALARPKLTAKELFDAGAQRVSLGSSLAWVAMAAMAASAEQIRDDGDFTSIKIKLPELGDWLD